MVLTMEMRFVLTLERRIGFMYGQVRGRECKVGQLLSSKACGDRKACGWLGDGEETGADNGGYNGQAGGLALETFKCQMLLHRKINYVGF